MDISCLKCWRQKRKQGEKPFWSTVSHDRKFCVEGETFALLPKQSKGSNNNNHNDDDDDKYLPSGIVSMHFISIINPMR